MLSPVQWQRLEQAWGGHCGQSIDLMALDSNVMRAKMDRHYLTLPLTQPRDLKVSICLRR